MILETDASGGITRRYLRGNDEMIAQYDVGNRDLRRWIGKHDFRSAVGCATECLWLAGCRSDPRHRAGCDDHCAACAGAAPSPDDLGFLPDGAIKHQDTELPRPGLSLSYALHSRFFWMLTLAFSLSYLSAAAIRVHFIPFLIETGIDASTAAVASGSIGIMQVAGRVVFAPLDSRLSGRVMIAGIFAMQAAAMGLLLLGSSLIAIGLFILVFGTSYGARTLARPSIIAELFGSTHYGRISSVMAIFLTAAATVAPVGAGILYDRLGSYDFMLWLVLVLALAATLVMIFAKPGVSQQRNT